MTAKALPRNFAAKAGWLIVSIDQASKNLAAKFEGRP